MRTKFDEQLKQLNESLIEMGRQCQDCITYATQALITENFEMAKMAIQLEKDIDESERDIQNLCTKMLLQQQPVAHDLKAIQAALKMIVDMERIGDQGSDIAEIIKRNDCNKFDFLELIAKMADCVIKMLFESIAAFVNQDSQKAKGVLKMDDEVDALFFQTKQELVEMILSDKQKGAQALETLMIAKYLERIGDHTVNISESVVGMLE